MKIMIQAKTGLNLSALVGTPKSSKPFPLVILLHGNTGWKEEVHLETLSAQLVESGIATIRFDAPGLGESEGTWADDYRVSNYIAAIDEVYEWALENMDINKTKIAIWGHSMGGLVAICSAAQNPTRYAALCGCQPSTGKAPQTDDWEEKGGFEMKTQIFGKIWLPKEFFEDRMQYESSDLIKKVTIPQLYIAGSEDKLVPVDAVKKIYEVSPGPKKYKEFKTNHFYKEDPEILNQINDCTVYFFSELLHGSRQ